MGDQRGPVKDLSGGVSIIVPEAILSLEDLLLWLTWKELQSWDTLRR